MNNVRVAGFFIWGLKENCSLGDRTSDSSETPLQRGSGGCWCSVAKSRPTLCDTMNFSTRQASLPFTISLSLLELMAIGSVMPSNHLFLCCPILPLPSIFPRIRVFSSESALRISGLSIGASASRSVLPMNIQGWFFLGLTGLMSLLSKGLSRIFSSTIVWNINSSALILLYGPALTSVYDYWKKIIAFTIYGPLSAK